MADEQLAKG